MPLEKIKALRVKDVAADDCALFLWTTFPMLAEALEVIRAWGFKYKTNAFLWLKLTRTGKKFFFGLGRWTRGNAELCLLATKGRPKRISKGVFSVIQYPIARHSAKPPVIRDKIIELMGELPRIELFAREESEGWDVWGNEVSSVNAVEL